MTDLTVAQERHQTPGVNNLIHFNNAGAALMPNVVVDGIKKYLDSETTIGGYETARHFAKELDAFYDHTAALINCQPSEIAFTESATVAWQRAFHALALEKGDVIITCMSEYASNYIAYLQLAKMRGIVIVTIPNDENGAIDIQALESAITPQVKLITLCHIPTGNGLINPAKAVGVIAQKHKILYLLDACQSVGQHPIDVENIGCDFLSATGRKYLRGPRGTGFLYARHATTADLEPMSLDLHSAEWTDSNTYQVRRDAKKYETWECNFSAKYGLSLAIAHLNQLGIEQVQSKIKEVANYCRTRLGSLAHIEVMDTGTFKSGIITFISTKSSAEEIMLSLASHQVNVSVIVEGSSLFDLQDRVINEAVRASVHYYNTLDEVDTFIALLESI
jgi:selenocysteine lyase/cysteine desulfurase